MNPPAAPRPLGDFADWLSPMLVKELRQGMRTRVFVLSFILLQVLMTLNVVIGLLNSARGADSIATTSVFWSMVGLPVLLVLPLSGLGAISGEKAANTLELIFLTRLSAWRIVFGKWFAIVAQTALFLCAVLPYVVLRYFMGGVNLGDEVVGLALMLAGSAVLTAIAVGISPMQTRVVRIFSTLAIVFSLQFVSMFILGGMTAGVFGATSWSAGSVALDVLVYGTLMVLLMLQIGAARIAPPAENHALAKRLIGLAFLAAAGVLWACGASLQGGIFMALAGCLPVLIGAVCEPLRWNRALLRPFVRRGWAGRFAGRLFYPGWPSGVLYTLLVAAAFGLVLHQQKMLATDRALLVYLGGFGAILFGALCVRLFFPRTESPLALFIATIAVCTVLTILASILDNMFGGGVRVGVCLLPPCAFILNAFPILDEQDCHAALLFCALSTALTAIAILILALSALRGMRQLEKEAVAAP